MAEEIKAGSVGINAENNIAKPKILGGITGKGFKPGESGNPSGRPKKKPITSAYARAVENPADADKLAKALFDKACTGDVNAAKELREGIEGKALQAVRLDGELGVTTEQDRKSRVLDMLREGAQRIEGQ